jgi:oligopeptide transport system substrate-binding protein
VHKMVVRGQRLAGALALATWLAAAVLGCARDRLDWPARRPGDHRGGVLRLAAAEDVPALDPAIGYDTTSWFFEQHLFETLVTYDESNTLVPALAERWEISPDRRSYRFVLATGALFSDGTPLTADDVTGSLERVLDPRTRSQGAEYFRGIRGAHDYTAGTAASVAGLVAVDARTLVIELLEPDPLFLNKLALMFAAVVPVALARRLGDDFATQPIGSGPFVLREWRRGDRIVLARNPRYRRPDLPFLDGIVEQIGVNQQLAWLMFESGELDVAPIPPADFPAVMRDPARLKQTIHATTLTTAYLGLNCQMPPLDDRRVRQALSYAVNRAEVIALLNGRGVVARGIVPPSLLGYHADVPGYGFDPVKARALLAEAGHAQGFATELWTQGADTDVKIAQKIQQDLAKIGVELSIKLVAWSPFLEAIRRPRTVPIFDLGWSADFPDPSNFLDVLFHSSHWDANNHTFYGNPAVDRLLDRARALADKSERWHLYAEAERLIVDDAPAIFLYHPIAYVIHHPRVHGYAIHAFLPARVTEVWLDPEP